MNRGEYDMNEKVLFLDCDKEELYRKERKKIDNLSSKLLYNKINFLNKIIRFLGIYFFSPLLYLAYGDWKKELYKYDVFILPSRKSAKFAVKYIKKKTNKRVIVWYWNMVTAEEMKPEYCKKYNAEVWTFNENDAKKYKMNYNDAYYFDTLADQMNYKQNKKDIFYIGVEKQGRIEILDKIKQELINKNINFDIRIVKNPNYKGNETKIYDKELKYEEVLKNIKQSKAILDINAKGQVGLTLRPLEALFFKKKLVTNNSNIVNYKFYNRNNIFIIGKDDMNEIDKFINSDYVEIPEKVVGQYRFENWLKRLLNNNYTEEEGK